MTKPAGRPFIVKVAIGLLGGAAFSWVLFGLPPLIFAIGVTVLAIMGVREMYRGVRRHGAQPNEPLGYVACAVLQYGAWTHGGQRFVSYLPAVLILLLQIALLFEMLRPKPKPVLNVGSTMLGVVWVGWMASFTTLLRNSGIASPHLLPGHTHLAEWITFFVAGSTWLSDGGGMFVGRSFGRRKLAPTISPAKTIEGALGGLVVAALFGLLIGHIIQLPILHSLILAAICSISGLFGDLTESAMKRDLEIKDFGAALPGHGGILDRIDSILFSAPLAYYYVVFVLVNQGIVLPSRQYATPPSPAAIIKNVTHSLHQQ